MERIFTVDFAGHPVDYSFLYRGTARCFGQRIRLSRNTDFDIRMSPITFESVRSVHPADVPDEYVEYKGLIHVTAQFLLRYNCCIMHAVSFIFQGKAWLLSAPSGTGKTTQYVNWQNTFPGEIIMISGDMPVLELIQNENIIVHPSPWNGKERIYSDKAAPLGGIILLEQDITNTLSDLTPDKALMPVWNQFMVIPDTEEEILQFTAILKTTLETARLGLFRNDGTVDSTNILRQWILDGECI